MEPSRRTRGGSFHEEFDSIGSEPPKLANRHQLEGEMRFITPYFDHSYMPEPLDPSQLEDDLEDELEEEELLYTRGRSRSRSIHSDESPPVVSDSPQTPVKTAPIPIPIPPSNPHKATTEKVERTGPLHSREVLALQKVNISFSRMLSLIFIANLCLSFLVCCVIAGFRRGQSRSRQKQAPGR